MRTTFIFFFVCFGLETGLTAQPLQQSAQDAYLISRMVEKFHVQPRPLDQQMSSAIYSDILEELDGQRLFFTKDDMVKLNVYRFRLDEEIRNRQTGFLQLLIGIYKQRLIQADTMIDKIATKPFNFSVREKYTLAEDTAHPADVPPDHSPQTKPQQLHARLPHRDTIPIIRPAPYPAMRTW